MKKYRLMTPGPVSAPAETLLELAKPIVHHRTAEARERFAEAVQGLQQVFATNNPIVLLTSSGTGAMETAVANAIRPGQKVVAVSAGKFGERWVEICEAFGVDAIVIDEEYGRAVDPQRIANALGEHPDVVAVLTTLCETSTGVAHDIASIGRIVADTDALLLVDGISGVGAVECRTDDWHIDMLAVGSQKALMLPPGLAFLTVSEKARRALDAPGRPRTYYFDLKKALAMAAENDTPYTPAHTLISALCESLRQILATGIEDVWRRTACLSEAMQSAAAALGLALLADRPATALTAIKAPDHIDADRWVKLLESKYGLKVAGGQGKLKGKIIRIAHMGYVDEFDVVGIVACLEWSLLELGCSIQPGAGVSAASRVLAEKLVPSSHAAESLQAV